MRYDLIAVGDVMLDGALPEPAVGRRVHGRIELGAGGSAVGAALAAAGLGAHAAVVGRIGADAGGQLVADALAAAGVDALLARDEAARTGCLVVVGDASIVADPGANLRFSPDDVPATLEARAVLVSGYSLLQAGPEAAALAAFTRARADWLAVDGASARLLAAFGVDHFLRATSTAGVLLVNAEEAQTLTGGLEAEEAALTLARRYRIVCVKLGRVGAVAASGGEIARVEVQPVDRKDTLGAGDAFAGGFLVALSRGADLAAALRLGCDTATDALVTRDRPTLRPGRSLRSPCRQSRRRRP